MRASKFREAQLDGRSTRTDRGDQTRLMNGIGGITEAHLRYGDRHVRVLLRREG